MESIIWTLLWFLFGIIGTVGVLVVVATVRMMHLYDEKHPQQMVYTNEDLAAQKHPHLYHPCTRCSHMRRIFSREKLYACSYCGFDEQ